MERIKKLIGFRQKDGFIEILSFSHYEYKGKYKKLVYNIKCHNCGNLTKKFGDCVHSQKSCGCLLENYQKNILPNLLKNKFTKDESQLNRLYGDYKNRAENKGLEFTLDKEEFLKLTQQNCYYCGSIPKKDISKRIGMKDKQFKVKFIYNGIDRINSKEGYNNQNVVPCCYICNYAKRNLTLEEFNQWIKNLVEFMNIKFYRAPEKILLKD